MEKKTSLQLTTIEKLHKNFNMNSFRSESVSIEINLSEGKFMDLIRITKEEIFEVRAESLEEINKYSDHHIAFVSFSGPIQTGKTYLFLKLLNIIPSSSEVFLLIFFIHIILIFAEKHMNKNSVGMIKMWKTPLFLDYIDTYVFFLDTEGYVEGDSIKESILLITLILSSVFILNTNYSSDYLSDFKIFPNILKKLCFFPDDNQEDIPLFLAKMLLIQRDFKQNPDISNNLLQNAYNIFEEPMKNHPQLQEIKKTFMKLFKERDYILCSPPIIEEFQLNNLIENLNKKVTEEFNQELNKIRDKLLFQIKPKSFFNIVFTPKMMSCFIKELVKEVNEKLLSERNSNKCVVMSSVWKNVMENMFNEALHEIFDYYYDELQKFFVEDKPRKRSILIKLLLTMREEVRFSCK